MSLGTWRTELVLGQDVQRDVGTPLVPSAPGLHIGIVGEYKQDPENLNRLRVKVPSLQTDDTPLWARFAAPYASKERGLCFYPEPGDEVVLGFFAEDPRYPVILGSMHNPKNKPPYAPSVGNNQKGLVLTQGGNEQQLLFDTKAVSAVLVSGKEKIALQKGAKIESDGPVQLAGSKIDIAAKQQVNLQGQSGVQIKGAKVDLSN
jgi:uncharacterized protein involved in type VI secretion and phage assembly